ncbi:MAG TPA: ABC transporter substrate-binding protein [Stellaceae bacterium]|nr:ABC transporter substrate-binding protein [Stellaceae bacterium]
MIHNPPTVFRFHVALAAGALALSLMLPAAAARAAADPGAFVAKISTQGIAALGPDVPSAERVERFSRLLRNDFDVDGIGAFALGRYRRMATTQEQQEFLEVYPAFTARALSLRLDDFSGASVRVIGCAISDGETVVSTEVTRRDGSRVPFDWHLTANEGGYKIVDIAVGGVSMRLALRNQFAAWIENNGGRFDALLAVLRQEIAALN